MRWLRPASVEQRRHEDAKADNKVQRIARKNFLLCQKQPSLKSLGFKRINIVTKA